MAVTPGWSGLPIVSVDAQIQLCSRLVPAPWDRLSIERTSLSLVDLRFLGAWSATDDEERAAGESGIDDDARRSLVDTIERYASAAPIGRSATDPHGLRARSDVAVLPDGDLILLSPQPWSLEPEGFVRYDHDGHPVGSLGADDLWIARLFNRARAVADAWQDAEADPDLAAAVATRAEFETRVGRLVAMDVIVSVANRPEVLQRSNVYHDRIREGFQLAAHVKSQMADAVAARQRELDRDGRGELVPVHAVVPASPSPPLALGAIYAMANASGDDRLDAFDLHPRWVPSNTSIESQPMGPAVYLFSDYMWSHERNLQFSRELKEHNPDAITIHGGPDCPTYERDTVTYLDTHPYVDIAVRGEGEATAVELLATLAAIVRGNAPWSTLASVDGIAFRDNGSVVRTSDRDRITDLDEIPSPYLDGTFAAYEHVPSIGMAIIESNRGCPYGCTFCDWGSATNSRIRKFDLERVKAELEWCARNEVKRVFFADANFGIFSRDVEIAAHFAELKKRFGYPERFITNYAKNTVKHLTEIVTVLTSAGVVTEGLLSLQSLDDTTLGAIRRSNIKLEKYEALAAEFRASDLPLFVDLMMGLPGQTVGSLRGDLQQCVDRGVFAKCHGTELLVNSPMNEPAYREEYAIETTRAPGPLAGTSNRPAFVVSTSSFTRSDYAEMHEMRRFYLLAENHGVLRYLATHVRQAIDLPEVDFYEVLRKEAGADPARWPWLSYVVSVVPDTLSPPPSWTFFVDDLHRFVVDRLAVPDDTALASALRVQHQMLPASGRRFPQFVELEHDYPAWLRTVNAARDGGHRDDWPTRVAPLSSFGPSTMTVDDPRLVSTTNLGHGSVLDNYNDWELESPVSRAVAHHYTV